MRRTIGGRFPIAGALTALLYMALAAPAAAMQVLEAADHAELRAEVAASGVSRIALVNDRIARVVRSAQGFEAEHDPASGDLYLRPLGGDLAGDGMEPGTEPAVLFLGTEQGFTYRLVLHRVEGGPAQVLIRNPAAVSATREADASDPRIGALVRLVGAVARREPLPGFRVAAAGESGGAAFGDAVRIVETWRGSRFEALVLALGAGAPGDAAALARRLGPGVAAVWIPAPSTDSVRLAVAVREIAGGVR